MFIYLHGFNSSPQSFKARLLSARLQAVGREREFVAPALPHRPRDAIATIDALLALHDPADVTLIGSSLGGHYATWFAERRPLRAVLVNPAIRPHELLAGALGEQTNLYTGERYLLTAEHLDGWRATHVDTIRHTERYLLVVAMGDAVLDSRIAVERFRGAMRIEHPGGDHGFAEFAAYVDAVLDFGAR